MHERTTVLAALPQPRHAASAAADVEASRRALRATDLSIEGARTYAPGISTGSLAVFRAFSTPSPAPPRRAGCSGRLEQDAPDHLHLQRISSIYVL